MKEKTAFKQTILLTADTIKQKIDKSTDAEECEKYAIAIRELAKAFKEVR